MVNNLLSYFKRGVFTTALIFFQNASASVQVAFIEYRKPNGEILQLEENGRFYHIAISHAGRWLQVHPYYGVVLSTEIELAKMGKIAEIVTLKEPVSLDEQKVNYFLGKPYDREFSWFDDKIYCSELVAKLLNIPPQPMYFSPLLWPKEYEKYNGLPGISPDKIFWLFQSQQRVLKRY